MQLRTTCMILAAVLLLLGVARASAQAKGDITFVNKTPGRVLVFAIQGKKEFPRGSFAPNAKLTLESTAGKAWIFRDEKTSAALLQWDVDLSLKADGKSLFADTVFVRPQKPSGRESEKQLFEDINAKRELEGKPALEFSESLSEIARKQVRNFASGAIAYSSATVRANEKERLREVEAIFGPGFTYQDSFQFTGLPVHVAISFRRSPVNYARMLGDSTHLGIGVAHDANAESYTMVIYLKTKGKSATVVGGFTPADVKTTSVIKVAEFAATSVKATLHTVVSAETQVVAGTNYRLQLKVKEGGRIRDVSATVYEDLAGAFKLTSFLFGSPPPVTSDKAEIQVVNETSGTIELFWLNDGKEASYGKIESKSMRTQGTFKGHEWIVRNGAGKELKRFAAAGGVEKTTVGGDSKTVVTPDRLIIRISNETKGPIELVLLEKPGKEVSHGKVEPKSSSSLSTIKGQEFVVRGAAGKELKRFVAASGINMITISGDSKTVVTPTADLAQMEKDTLTEVNLFRAEAKPPLPPFTWDDRISAIAREYAQLRVADPLIGEKETTDPLTGMSEGKGHKGMLARFRKVWEIYAGAPQEFGTQWQTARDAVRAGWANSPPHRKGMLYGAPDTKGLFAGVGIAKGADGKLQFAMITIESASGGALVKTPLTAKERGATINLVLDLFNKRRTARGLKALAFNPLINETAGLVASKWATSKAADPDFSFTTPALEKAFPRGAWTKGTRENASASAAAEGLANSLSSLLTSSSLNVGLGVERDDTGKLRFFYMVETP